MTDPFETAAETVRALLKSDSDYWARSGGNRRRFYADALAALDEMKRLHSEGLRHIVPGQFGDPLEVTCEDYDSYVAGSLSSVKSRAQRAEAALLEWWSDPDNPPLYAAELVRARSLLKEQGQ